MKFAPILLSGLVYSLIASASITICGAATVDEITLYNKPDRQKILVDGARKEGKISWYTSLIVDQVVRPVKEAFEKSIHSCKSSTSAATRNGSCKNVRGVSGETL